MKKIALLGENPKDCDSVKNLFAKEYEEIEFKPLLFGINGSALDNPDNAKLKRLLRREYEDYKPDFLIFIRDLDALKSDKKKLNERRRVFSKIKKIVDKNALFMLNIWELEALILADLETFNIEYQVIVELDTKPNETPDPKELLKNATKGNSKTFNESDNPFVFNLLRFKVIAQNHQDFNSFIRKFNKKLTD